MNIDNDYKLLLDIFYRMVSSTEDAAWEHLKVQVSEAIADFKTARRETGKETAERQICSPALNPVLTQASCRDGVVEQPENLSRRQDGASPQNIHKGIYLVTLD